ncbi:hypothetical protein MSP8887_03602 [Marinomonas spartinae]|uniref:nucleotidyltransferase domain-containing protein n=1 Tax=Marinomonas spartinae TaxID=1792290 RepID=UPI000808A2B0|nr:nucleotidyltransferase domain-containing protein [Marinomonas spartinae]SBS39016.1 hypothetical protein MSP8887_03602 [Marinomonas spartinae]
MFDFVGEELIKKLFNNVNYDVKYGLLDIKKAKLVVEKLLQEIIFFPIECIFLFGSAINGSFKPYSDIDVVN